MLRAPSALLEVVACTVDDVLRAEAVGADRIELVAAISEGGLTPSLGTLIEVRRRSQIPLVAMIRPRGGGFVYSEAEYETTLRDAEILLDHGANGLVVGILTPEGEIDVRRMRRFVELAGARPVVCHRAFDKTPNLTASLEALIEIGVRRVLTSGGCATASEGAARLRDLIRQAAGRIEILVGGGVRSNNAATLVAATGATQLHMGPFVPVRDAYDGDPSSHLALEVEEVDRTRAAL